MAMQLTKLVYIDQPKKEIYKVTFELSDSSTIYGFYYSHLNWDRWIEEVDIDNILFINHKGEEVSIPVHEIKSIRIDHPKFELVKKLNRKQ